MLQMWNRLSYCASNVSHKNNEKKSGNLASLWPVNSFLDLCFPKAYLHITEFSISRAGATSPVGQVSTGPLFSPSALTADLGDYDAIARSGAGKLAS